ncbi:hypothetical protein [Methylobacterium symbioticum]|jgi:hypothetical protein|uniref:Lysozyme inhibitor LprI N-terminal domain-containing protein n=1 Tax=Methylobacterium symbioticum TaxID=2584084 RepID=A0A509EMY7_9HYPH|nr:hypothetical protein [Methylobacterium symbioticum]VUD74829.1 hypothetical protein MET9862_05462 [Methylobacterium symbioticum]
MILSTLRRSLLAALVLGPVSAQAQAGADGTCPRDVLVAQSMQRQAIDQLEQADGDEAKTCRIWRRHVDTMRRVASVYGRCLSGSERNERLAQVQGSEREFSTAIKTRCRGS